MSAAIVNDRELILARACATVRETWSPAERQIRSLLATAEQARLMSLLLAKGMSASRRKGR